jgi:hypothetical protein
MLGSSMPNASLKGRNPKHIFSTSSRIPRKNGAAREQSALPRDRDSILRWSHSAARAVGKSLSAIPHPTGNADAVGRISTIEERDLALDDLRPPRPSPP